MVEANLEHRNQILNEIAGRFSFGELQIRTGSPGGADNAATGTLIVSIPLPGTPFAGASGSEVDKTGTWSEQAAVTGPPGHFRLVSSDGLEVREGTAGGVGSGADMEVSLVDGDIVAGGTVTVDVYRVIQLVTPATSHDGTAVEANPVQQDSATASFTEEADMAAVVAEQNPSQSDDGAGSFTEESESTEPVFEEVASGSSATSNFVATDTQLQGGANQLYMVHVACQPTSGGAGNVTGITGGGLSWSLAGAQTSGRGATRIEVWTAFGSPGSSFTVSANWSKSVNALTLIASRYSGASENLVGVETVNTGGTDNNNPVVTTTSLVQNSIHYVTLCIRHGLLSTPDPDYTLLASRTDAGSGGAKANSHAFERLTEAIGDSTFDTLLNGNSDWSLVAAVIEPSGEAGEQHTADANEANPSQSDSASAVLDDSPVIASVSADANPSQSEDVEGSFNEPAEPGDGIWISQSEIDALPQTGSPYDAVINTADGSWQTADIGDQNSNHDVQVLAGALAWAKTGNQAYFDKAEQGLLDVIGTEDADGVRWLAIGRNLASYAIAADILNLRDDGDPNSSGSQIEAWIAGFFTKNLEHNNTGEPVPFDPYISGSNAAAQEGFAFAACAAYLGDQAKLDRVYDAHRTYAGDPTAPDNENIDLGAGVASGWAHDDQNPLAINPLNSEKEVPAGRPGAGEIHNIDGAIINDIRRGDDYQWPPVWTQYPWTGLEGFIPCAVILYRAGYTDVWTMADGAVARTLDYLWFLRQDTGNVDWFDGSRSNEVIALANHYLGSSYLLSGTVGMGRCVGFTDWTHP